jgi:glyoxylase-like metal-dependent hydrolase (beta-lactamase superfamily II)
MPLNIRLIVSRPFEENSYVVWREGRPDALVIDPGMEPEAILDCLEQEGLTLAGILNTHGHADHIAGNASMKKAYPDAPLVIGKGDAPMLTDAELNLSAAFGAPITSPPADRVVEDGEVIEMAGIPLEVRHIPGHSPGHVVFVHHGPPVQVFGGDVLFAGSIGRCDFPGGSMKALLTGIREKLLSLGAEAEIYPGHGPDTTAGEEEGSNPFLV